MISSVSNQQIKNIIQLQKKSKARKNSGTFVIEGIKMFREVPEDKVEKVYINESLEKCIEDGENHFNNVEESLVTKKDCNQLQKFGYEVVSDSVFKEISETITPQGVLAIVKQPEYDFEKILKKDSVRLIFLEAIRDPGNLGTIVRTSEGAGFDGIVLSKESVDMYNPKVIRSTMGAIYRIPFTYEDNFTDALDLKYKKAGIKLYAAYLEGANDYAKAIYDKKTGIIIGNEANGITDETVAKADEMIKIPMKGKVESLNAAVSAALIMYEVDRQSR